MKYLVTIKAEIDMEIEAETENMAKIKALNEVDVDDFDTVITYVDEYDDEI